MRQYRPQYNVTSAQAAGLKLALQRVLRCADGFMAPEAMARQVIRIDVLRLFQRGRRLASLVMVAFVTMAAFNSVAASETGPFHPFRIGTGGNAGAYFPIGSLIAEALSHRRSAEKSGENDVHGEKNGTVIPELLVLAQRSSGSAANVDDIQNGLLESGLVQANIAHWAYHGAGPFQNAPAHKKLRTIASLYLESLHLVVRSDVQITGIDDLVGHRVSVDEVGSGTQLDVNSILRAYGLGNDDVKLVYLKPTESIDRLRKNQLDAFFIVAGFPVAGVSELVADGKARVLPITGPKIEALLKASPFFVLDTIPANTYANTDAVPTLAVAAQWIVCADVDNDLIYRLTELLWSKRTRRILSAGHPKGREVNLSTALAGIGIPMHPGAERYYKELGFAPTAPHAK